MLKILALTVTLISAAFIGQQRGHLRVEGTQFVRADGTPFEWRGISAFRLLEFVAHGREAEADAYLKWAASKKLTVVRVLAMAGGIFPLPPADGVRALPRLLELAQKHGIVVEVVALASTAEYTFDLEAHVRAVARISARYPNAVLELANEPTHRSQVKLVHDPGQLKRLADAVPKEVPVALGDLARKEAFGAADYATWHSPRHPEWKHILIVAGGSDLVTRLKKPVVSDEPIGAGDRMEQGRRDNAPERFRAQALATRLAGLEATFHYNGGVQATPLTPTEIACLDAWIDGLNALPRAVTLQGHFRRAEPGDAVVTFDAAQVAAVFVRSTDTRAWALAVGVKADPQLRPRGTWREVNRKQWPGVHLIEYAQGR
jgi:hypothetical protein